MPPRRLERQLIWFLGDSVTRPLPPHRVSWRVAGEATTSDATSGQMPRSTHLGLAVLERAPQYKGTGPVNRDKSFNRLQFNRLQLTTLPVRRRMAGIGGVEVALRALVGDQQPELQHSTHRTLGARRVMVHQHSESLEASLLALIELETAHLDLGRQMFEAFGGALYGMDLLAAGALNRSKAHIAGFRDLLEAKNLICAGALLRLQLDTAMRFYAGFLVERPHDFALAVLSGERVRDLKDRAGKRMTDAYLVQRLGEEFDWVPRVYERTSGYVHLSSTHLVSALSLANEVDPEDRTFTIKISEVDKPLPETIYIEASDAFRAATEILLRYVQGWVFTKANPELVQQMRAERENGGV